ncbi:immunoglobulin-like domain-containing protein [Haloplasma contractile]|uniref:Beta-fructosidase protein n=1 Tax=Haloplasma contractile SSD-17B TaxID=1033810 RepID=F7PWA5_9MOLU|nr:immunoglobulin-like domain-containing protein [Haloplasma contractile]ERJ11237.1 beta-fructosidase protein [Haloplasma contractile SSD-17B]
MKNIKLFMLITFVFVLISCEQSQTGSEVSSSSDPDVGLITAIEIEVFESEDDFDFTELVIGDTDIISSDALSYNLSTLNLDVVGDYTITVTYMLNGEKVTEDVTITVVDRVNPVISGLENQTVTVGSDFNLEDGVTATDNYDGDLTLELVVDDHGGVDLLTAGEYAVTYTVTDSSGNQTVENISITVIEPPEFQGLVDLTFEVGTVGSTIDWFDGVTCTQFNGDAINLTGSSVDYSVVNFDIAGEYEVEYTVTDENGVTTTATRTVTIIERQTYSIEFVDQLVYLRTDHDSLKLFDYNDFIHAIKDAEGNAVELDDTGNKLEINGYVDPTRKDEYDVTYRLRDQNDNIVYEDTKTITVVEQLYYIYDIDDDENPRNEIITASEHTGENFDYSSLYEIYDYNGVRLTDLSQFIIEYEEINFAKPGDQTITIYLYDLNHELIDKTYVNVMINAMFTINFKENRLSSSTSTLDLYALIESISDSDGNVIPLNQTNTYYGYPVIQLTDTLMLIALDVTDEYYDERMLSPDYDPNRMIGYMIFNTSFDNIYHTEFLDFYLSEYKINIKENLRVNPNDSTFDPLYLIEGITDLNGNALTIGTDVFIETIHDVDVTTEGSYKITYELYDSAHNYVLSHEIEVYVGADFSAYFNDPTVTTGEYTVDTFVPSIMISTLWDNGTNRRLTISETSIEYEGVVNFNETGDYLLKFYYVDDYGVRHALGEQVLKIVDESDIDLFDIQFKSPIIRVNTYESFTPSDYIKSITDSDGNELDLNHYTIEYEAGYNTIYGNINRTSPETFLLTYNIKDKNTYKVVYSESILVQVISPIIIELTDESRIIMTDSFSLHDLIDDLYDRNRTTVNLAELGYTMDIDVHSNITNGGNSLVTFILYDDTGNPVVSTRESFNFYQEYEVNFSTNPIKIPVNTSAPELASYVSSIKDNINNRYLQYGVDYEIEVIGNPDFTTIGTYDLKFVVKDLDGVVLTEERRSLYVYDSNYVVPNSVTVEIESPIYVTPDQYDAFDLNNYVIGFYDENGNELDANLFDILKRDFEFEDIYMMTTSAEVVYFVERSNILGSATVTIYPQD